MTTWHWLMFSRDDGRFTVPHAVPDTLLDAIVADLAARGAVVSTSKETREVGIDEPGMVFIDRPYERIDVDGLTLEIPSEDFATFHRRLGALAVRHANGDAYYKLHGWERCVVLTPSQRDALLAAMAERAPGAEATALAFFRDRKSPADILREMAAKVSGCDVADVPDLGGHKVDRFINATRGES